MVWTLWVLVITNSVFSVALTKDDKVFQSVADCRAAGEVVRAELGGPRTEVRFSCAPRK